MKRSRILAEARRYRREEFEQAHILSLRPRGVEASLAKASLREQLTKMSGMSPRSPFWDYGEALQEIFAGAMTWSSVAVATADAALERVGNPDAPCDPGRAPGAMIGYAGVPYGVEFHCHEPFFSQRSLIRTLEGLKLEEAGDWIFDGVDGQLWPASPERGEEIYEPAL